MKILTSKEIFEDFKKGKIYYVDNNLDLNWLKNTGKNIIGNYFIRKGDLSLFNCVDSEYPIKSVKFNLRDLYALVEGKTPRELWKTVDKLNVMIPFINKTYHAKANFNNIENINEMISVIDEMGIYSYNIIDKIMDINKETKYTLNYDEAIIKGVPVVSFLWNYADCDY